MGKSKSEISILNVALCLLVVFIHVSSAPLAALQKDSWQYMVVFVPWRLSAFVVQGFFFLSGLKLFLKSGKRDYRAFYRSRLTKILLPYLLWVGLYYLYFVHHSYFPFAWGDLLRYALDGSLVSPFYFVVALTQFYVLMPLWDKLVEKCRPLPLLGCTLVFTLLCNRFLPTVLAQMGMAFPYNDRLFTTYVFYWLGGCVVGRNYTTFVAALQKHFSVVALSFGALLLGDAFFGYRRFVGIASLPLLEEVHFFYCVSAILFFYGLCLWLGAHTKLSESPLLRGIDEASYSIYLVHCLVIVVANDIMETSGLQDVLLTYSLRIVLTYGLGIGLCLLYHGLRKVSFRKSLG